MSPLLHARTVRAAVLALLGSVTCGLVAAQPVHALGASQQLGLRVLVMSATGAESTLQA
ncbi:MAG: hypothetical protein FJ100_11520 [Deltaproteobacteria bacterium]|nr:hypothetical protein [Deltaproteobacteria bacterium]